MAESQIVEFGFDPPLPLVEYWVPQVTSGKALELGYGQGQNAALMAERGFVVDAVDCCRHDTMTYSPEEVLTFLSRYAHRYGLSVATHDVDMEVFLREIPDNTYDVVVATYVLHFLTHDRQELLYARVFPEMLRVMRPAGRLICTMLKSKQDVEAGYSEMFPYRVIDYMGDAALRAVWDGRVTPRYYAPERWDDRGAYRYCHWELVADK